MASPWLTLKRLENAGPSSVLYAKTLQIALCLEAKSLV
jgi:hypothetical protein